MQESSIRRHGGIPTLFVNGKPVVPCAYITYFTERECYQDFAGTGMKLYSVCCNFAGQTVNPKTRPAPFTKGIFDDPSCDDFSVFDADMEKLIKCCPDAMVFPRVNISMPRHWEEAHPEECCDSGVDGYPPRFCMSSDLWRRTGSEYLQKLIEHIHQSPYAENIIGYQIAAATTEEWLSIDNLGSNGPAARKKFAQRFPDSEIGGEDFYRYLNEITAETICYFANLVKDLTGHRQIVGSFYGYTFEVSSRTSCHHAMRKILENDAVDFICSPGSYLNRMSPELGWPLMLPLESLKLHGKLYFAEYDTRTHLTKFMDECRKDACTDPAFHSPRWLGHDKRLSIGQLRMNMTQQLAEGYASWWFDMWGGWFADKDIMRDIADFQRLLGQSLNDADRSSVAEVALFADETSSYADPDSGMNGGVVRRDGRRVLTQTGVPIAYYELGDFAGVIARYRFAVFFSDMRTPLLEQAEQYCREHSVPFLTAEPGKPLSTAAELREHFRKAGVHLWCDGTDAVYASQNFVSLHSADSGNKRIYLKKRAHITPVFPAGNSFEGEYIDVYVEKGDTVLFRLD